MAVLKAGKHLWLEKPMTETSLQARQLLEEAEKRNLILFVDHTFVYTGAVRKMQEIVPAANSENPVLRQQPGEPWPVSA